MLGMPIWTQNYLHQLKNLIFELRNLLKESLIHWIVDLPCVSTSARFHPVPANEKNSFAPTTLKLCGEMLPECARTFLFLRSISLVITGSLNL
jgi:hypothetical protein